MGEKAEILPTNRLHRYTLTMGLRAVRSHLLVCVPRGSNVGLGPGLPSGLGVRVSIWVSVRTRVWGTISVSIMISVRVIIRL